MTLPHITVIIPTRERSDVLAHALRTVTAQDYDGLEILVSDNASTDSTREVIGAAADPRIRYVNPGRRLSMSEHWEFALTHARDGWIAFIGDDDGFPPGAIAKAADIISRSSVDALRSRFCTFDWPSVLERRHGRLIIPMQRGLEERDSARWLAKVAGARARYTELPMIYNGGFVRKEILDRISLSRGRVFGSAIPDVYSGIAIARVTDRYLYSHEPLAISGTSRHSTGTSTHAALKGRHAAPAKSFYGEGNLEFHEAMPLNADGSYPHSLHALVYECLLQSEGLGDRQPVREHRRQLELILASETPHRASITAWGEQFSLQHGIDFAEALRRANRRQPFVHASATIRKVLDAANSIIIDTPVAPLSNVYEASVAIGTVRANPSRLHSLPTLWRQHRARD